MTDPTDPVGIAALVIVSGLLLIGIWRQFTLLGRRAQIIDSLGLLPQWKFFAQADLATRDDCFDDLHLLARIAGADRQIRPWQPVFWPAERRGIEALWNPHLRSRGHIGGAMDLLVEAGDAAGNEPYLSALHYLTLLRFCLDQAPPGPAEALQFAVIATRGRTDRQLFVRYLSAWHSA